MPVRDQRANGPAEATRWVEDALENARESFPEMPDDELRGPLEQAFELASSTARGEREFHTVFEGELRRVLEERDVFGSAGSVLRRPSSDAPTPFQPVADVPPPQESEPEAEPEPEPADGDRADALALAIGALRFRDGLSPEEIQDDQGIDPAYYVEVMQWLSGEVDATLDAEYPGHLDRERLAAFAAGLEDVETSAAIESHTRECAGCAMYLADLLDGLLQMVEPEASGSPHSRKPVMRVTADELRKHASRVATPSASRSVPRREPARVRRRRRTTVDRDWRRTGGLVALLGGVALAAVVVAIDIRGTPGSDRPASDITPGVQRSASDRSTLGSIFPEVAERSGKSRTRHERSDRAKRTRPERSARAERPRRRSQPPSTTPAPSRPKPAPASPPASSAPAPASAPPASPPPTPSPPAAPASPPPASPPPTQSPPPSGEFGLEP